LLHANNIVFLGPPGSAMRALGDKISSSIVAQSADVPTLAWSGSGLQVCTSFAFNHKHFFEFIRPYINSLRKKEQKIIKPAHTHALVTISDRLHSW
jgi:hypothetical protein